jgi:aconitase A
MSVITGETWFKVPECISIQFVGQPQLGIGGKDIILHILGELKRNTVAAEKVVEFSGPGCRYLSVDARFAIANMCTVSHSRGVYSFYILL